VNCTDTNKLLHAYSDGELDLTTALAIEQHLQDCRNCARAHADLQALRTTLAGGALYFEPPRGLRDRVQAATRGAADAPRAPRVIPWRGLAIAASVAFLMLAGWEAFRLLTPRPVDDAAAGEVVALHIRSLMLANHRVDVKSSNQHEVKPFFEDKLDFPPPVYDLSSDDFELLGGRLEYVQQRPAAALVYQRRKHHINLYVWRTPDADTPLRATTRQQYHLVTWTHGGLTFWGVSDLNTEELQEFARRFQEQMR
jgi:anti-sigma factor RsiW